MFAYTEDGNKISNINNVSGGGLIIPIAPTPVDNNVEERWTLQSWNTLLYTCSISGNLIELKLCGSTYVNVPSPHIEYDFTLALSNAYSFVIKGNELFIYFKKVENKDLLSNCTVIENKNLLILKKR